jgi:hypothetical protein
MATHELPAHLRADCQACCGLCCVALPFDAAQGFGFDKPAHVACKHLCADSRCGIHRHRAQLGFAACAAFDCHGAGQRVTQAFFGGAHWRDAGGDAPAMFRLFEELRELHALMALLHTAESYADPVQAQQLHGAYEALDSCAAELPRRGIAGAAAAMQEAGQLLAGLRGKARLLASLRRAVAAT